MREIGRDDLPGELSVFPLPGAMLLPGGHLPLNVFEPRYVALVEDALVGTRLFGMIQPHEHEPSPEKAEAARASSLVPPPLYRVGCAGRLSSFTERQDGTFSIVLTGICRFRLHHELEQRHGYRRLAVDYAPFLSDLSPQPPSFDRDALLDALRRYFQTRGFEARWDAVEQMDDETLITTLSMICPLPPAEKQALLEAPTPADRAGILRALLEMAGHEPEADGPVHLA
ncbi:LON peptidase substrate-binding domain-containing protein [Rhizosaccharibacter radicis]|uniref:LON peptidase substrate-binding domain-containing protein n=1 Tax=Rhizosaccharibacter radicis TaxID=2782605 RepID=A0ABT1VZ88_9PROT|nr:LON peptidase substrate-binding domain-containing protein [Acetobacteraceae bacterium KSS12]